jgi:mersacidin/lichenicidin family type 2 lantibiotic
MSHDIIIRAWKDEDYRLSLSEAERAALPQNPVGDIELSDEELLGIAGGTCTCNCSHNCYSADCYSADCTVHRTPSGCIH